MSGIVTGIHVKLAEELCEVNAEMLHETLTHLPAEKYMALYKLMTLEMRKVFLGVMG